MINNKGQAGDRSIDNDESAVIHSLGTLDWSIYGCISDKHVCDEVIITDEQLSHIREKHPEAFDDAIHYVKDVLSEPDYIIRDKRPNTGLVIKRITCEKESILLTLKICTAEDKEGYKNSLITSWKITEKRLDNYLRNKEVIYKRE